MADDMQDQRPLRSTDRSLPIALLRAREAVMEPVREMLSRSKISEQKWRVLRVMEEAGPVEQSVIAERACLLLPSLTRIVTAMEADGLLERAVSKEDRRKTIVTITEKGRGIIREHAPESIAMFTRLADEFGREDMDRLLDLLEKLQRMER